MAHVILIPARNESTWTGPSGNNTYLLTGAVAALIDAGVGAPEHLDEIARTLRVSRSRWSSSPTAIPITRQAFRHC